MPKKKSTITTVTYSRLKKTAMYENERVEATAKIGAGQTPEEALAEARAFVCRHLGLGPSETDYDKACKTVEDYEAINE